MKNNILLGFLVFSVCAISTCSAASATYNCDLGGNSASTCSGYFDLSSCSCEPRNSSICPSYSDRIPSDDCHDYAKDANGCVSDTSTGQYPPPYSCLVHCSINCADYANGSARSWCPTPGKCLTLPPAPVTGSVSAITDTTATVSGKVVNGDHSSVMVRGVCYGTSPKPTQPSCTTEGTGTGTFSSLLTGLMPNTEYYVRAYYATNPDDPVYEDIDVVQFHTFHTLPTPKSLITGSVSAITDTTASVSGNMANSDISSVTARGVCYGTSASPTIPCTTDGTGSGNFNSSLTGLKPGTTYYVRAYAINSDGTSYYDSNDVTVTTLKTPITGSVPAITDTTASVSGNVVNGDTSSVKDRGVCYGTSPKPTTPCLKDGIGTGTFNSSLTGLKPETQYYVRAYATNSAGTSYYDSNDVTVTTLKTPITGSVPAITDTTASVSGNVVDNNTSSVTDHGVCYGTSPKPTTPCLKDGTGTGTFNSSLTGLTPNTLYYVRAYATNSAGTPYYGSNDVTFTTLKTQTKPTTSPTSVDTPPSVAGKTDGTTGNSTTSGTTGTSTTSGMVAGKTDGTTGNSTTSGTTGTSTTSSATGTNATPVATTPTPSPVPVVTPPSTAPVAGKTESPTATNPPSTPPAAVKTAPTPVVNSTTTVEPSKPTSVENKSNSVAGGEVITNEPGNDNSSSGNDSPSGNNNGQNNALFIPVANDYADHWVKASPNGRATFALGINTSTQTLTLYPSPNSVLVDNRDGTISYTANSGFYGVDTVSYTLTDTDGHVSIYIVKAQVSQDYTGPNYWDFTTNTAGISQSGSYGNGVYGSWPPGAACDIIYAVNTQDMSEKESQFLYVDYQKQTTQAFGPLLRDYNFESVGINPANYRLYAVSAGLASKDKRGMLYLVDPNTAELTAVGNTGFNDIEDMTFRYDGTLWGWVDGKGIIQINPETAYSYVRVPFKTKKIAPEGLAWTTDGRFLYLGDKTDLWWWEYGDGSTLTKKCQNLPGDHVVGLVTLDDGRLMFSTAQIGEHKLYVYDPWNCKVDEERSFATDYAMIEGLARSRKCTPQPAKLPTAERWVASFNEGQIDSLQCQAKPGWITLKGEVTLTPAASQAMIQTNWQVIQIPETATAEAGPPCPQAPAPYNFDCRSPHYESDAFTGGEKFKMKVWWPGQPNNANADSKTILGTNVSVNILDLQGNPVPGQEKVSRTLWWLEEVCGGGNNVSTSTKVNSKPASANVKPATTTKPAAKATTTKPAAKATTTKPATKATTTKPAAEPATTTKPAAKSATAKEKAGNSASGQ